MNSTFWFPDPVNFEAMLRTVRATRYVTPLREGGSLPAIVEADDLGLYVAKFRGAGQGVLALAAEVIAGEIGRALGLQVPELVIVDVNAALGRNEPDYEIRTLLQSSVGINLGLDYLPGSTMFDPAAGDRTTGALASMIVWFDAFVTNVDRTARNPNLLYWHKVLYLIDHGASLYFHHDWKTLPQAAGSPFNAVKHHVLLPWATALEAADGAARERLNASVFQAVLERVPDEWLPSEPGVESPALKRAAYVEFLERRLASRQFLEEAIRARAELV